MGRASKTDHFAYAKCILQNSILTPAVYDPSPADPTALSEIAGQHFHASLCGRIRLFFQAQKRNSLLNATDVACNFSEMVFVRLSVQARSTRRLLITLLAVAARRHKATATATATKRTYAAFAVFVNKSLRSYLLSLIHI